MNVWLGAAIVLMAFSLVVGLVTLRGDPYGRLVAFEMTAVLYTLALVCLAQGFDRDVYFTVPVVMAVLSFAGNLVYVRFLERWL